MKGGENNMDNQNTTRGVSPLAAGITGIILGVAGTIAVAFAEEKTRKKITDKVDSFKNDLLEWSDHTMHDLYQKSYKVRKDLSEKLNPEVPKVSISIPSEKKLKSEDEVHD